MIYLLVLTSTAMALMADIHTKGLGFIQGSRDV